MCYLSAKFFINNVCLFIIDLFAVNVFTNSQLDHFCFYVNDACPEIMTFQVCGWALILKSDTRSRHPFQGFLSKSWHLPTLRFNFPSAKRSNFRITTAWKLSGETNQRNVKCKRNVDQQQLGPNFKNLILNDNIQHHSEEGWWQQLMITMCRHLPSMFFSSRSTVSLLKTASKTRSCGTCKACVCFRCLRATTPPFSGYVISCWLRKPMWTTLLYLKKKYVQQTCIIRPWIPTVIVLCTVLK